MDFRRLARLQALTGEKDIIDATAQLDLSTTSKRQIQSKQTSYIYEGTDEEETDDEIITSRAVNVQSTAAWDSETRSKPRSRPQQSFVAGIAHL